MRGAHRGFGDSPRLRNTAAAYSAPKMSATNAEAPHAQSDDSSSSGGSGADWGFFGRWVGISTLIGVLGGLAAVAFHWLTEAFRETFLARPLGIHEEGLGELGSERWWILVVPALGGVVVGALTQAASPEAEGHGTEQLIRTFHRLSGSVRRRVIAVKGFCSALTIGTGGSAGQEGPVAQIGSGIGSAISDAFKLSERDRRIFLLSGASAGIGALFTAPLGGALFAPEVLYRKPEFEGDAIIPCIISSIVGYTTYTGITGRTRAIPMGSDFAAELTFHGASDLPIYLALAVLVAIVGWLWVRAFRVISNLFQSLRRFPLALRAGFGGLLLGALALALAPIAGPHGVLFGGYELMTDAIHGELAVGALCLLAFAKILATSLSIGSGGSGGVFAPSLAIGALVGAAVGQGANQLFPGLGLNPACFALVGMGGFFAGVAKVPIASILMVSEMTGSYHLLAPLMLVSVLHVLIARNWSIYDTQVEGLVDSPAHAGDFVVDVLDELRVADVIDPERVPVLVDQNATLRRALDTVSTASGSYFPVVDGEQNLVGIFSLSDIRRIFLEHDVHDLVIVRDFMVDAVEVVTPRDSLNDALRKLNELAVHEVPVVDDVDPKKVVTMLTRNNLGAAYHRRLRELRRRSS